jgi:hypothetical protein
MNAAQLERAREWRKINYYGKPCELMDECLSAFAASETAKLTELQADAFETQRQQIEALKSDLKVETAAKEAAEKQAELWKDSCKKSGMIAAAAEAERDRAVRQRDQWEDSFNMYRTAWLREIGGVIDRKSHEIDGFVLRTRRIYEQSKKWIAHENGVLLKDPFASVSEPVSPVPVPAPTKAVGSKCKDCGATYMGNWDGTTCTVCDGDVEALAAATTKPKVLTAEDIERIGENATKNGSAINRNPQRF